MDILVRNRQRAVALNLRWLQKFARAVLPECLEQIADAGAPLRSLAAVEVTIISDRAIAEIHERFMQISGATDVITFDHGEILISAETARENAASFQTPLDHEIALYMVHGLLHLNGFTDAKSREAARMRKVQEQILASTLSQFS